MSDTEIAKLIAKNFIQRRDVKAKQSADGNVYFPVRSPFMMDDLLAHLNGEVTYGHYMLDQDDKVKLFSFDIDLRESGSWAKIPEDYSLNDYDWYANVEINKFSPQAAWKDRIQPPRQWMKYQFRAIVEKLSSAIKKEFDIPTAAAYSGNKGVHVYGFTGSENAGTVREAANLVLDSIGEFELYKGKNFFQHKNQHPLTGFPNFSIEVFPKQESLSSKDLGNLMRLPLGRNVKSNDSTFFINQRAALGSLEPHPDPVRLLSIGDPWRE